MLFAHFFLLSDQHYLRFNSPVETFQKTKMKMELRFCGFLMISLYLYIHMNDNIKTLYISYFNNCNTIRRALQINKNANMCKGSSTVSCENQVNRLQKLNKSFKLSRNTCVR